MHCQRECSTSVQLGRWRGRGLHEAAFLGEVVAIDPARDAVVSIVAICGLEAVIVAVPLLPSASCQ
jgi:hypothetical protein